MLARTVDSSIIHHLWLSTQGVSVFAAQPSDSPQLDWVASNAVQTITCIRSQWCSHAICVRRMHIACVCFSADDVVDCGALCEQNNRRHANAPEHERSIRTHNERVERFDWPNVRIWVGVHAARVVVIVVVGSVPEVCSLQ